MKFVADVMLGRLARLMRFAGYDVEYDSGAKDDFLLRRTRSRILLSRDGALVRRARPERAYFVENTGAQKQLEEIRQAFPNRTSKPRCLVCNHAIRRIRKDRIRHLIPAFVYENKREFFRCGGCARIYWKGSHFERLTRMIK